MKNEIITADDVLGKDALTPDGRVLGIITKLHLGSVSKQLVGITVDLGFFSPDLFIGIDYVNRFGKDVVFLLKTPTQLYRGRRVLSSSGNYLGKVSDVRIEKGDMKEIVVKKGKEIKNITITRIANAGESIILK